LFVGFNIKLDQCHWSCLTNIWNWHDKIRHANKLCFHNWSDKFKLELALWFQKAKCIVMHDCNAWHDKYITTKSKLWWYELSFVQCVLQYGLS
jgi:hypothetical protein